MNNKELVAKLTDIAKNYKTLYVMGCIGAPLTEANKNRYCNNHSYNKTPSRTAMIRAASNDTFGFDCVCLIKSVLWGWNGSTNKVYGGATPYTNGVPDIDADAMIGVCKEPSTDFSKIEIGEALWVPGHIGIYIGDGLAVECTPSWDNEVQITACNAPQKGYNRRDWQKHGKLPYITYVKETPTKKPTSDPVPVTNTTLKEGDLVKVAANAVYYNGSQMPDFVKGDKWYVIEVDGDRAVIDENESKTNSICSAVNVKYLSKVGTEKTPTKKVVKKGSLVKVASNAVWYNGTPVPDFVKNDKWYVAEVDGDRAVIDKNASGTNSICSPINIKYLTVV